MAARDASKVIPMLRTADSGFERAFGKLLNRRTDGQEAVQRSVRKILERVRAHGDTELRALTKKLDGATLEELEVQPAEFEEAGETIDAADRAALGKAAMRIREFHRKRIASSWEALGSPATRPITATRACVAL